MQKAKMQTEDGVQGNIAKIKRLFPHCVTEARGADGKLAHKVDFELLKQELSGELIEEGEERYCLNWPGCQPLALSVLRSCSVSSSFSHFATTTQAQEAVFAEGKNREVKMLLPSSF